MKKLYSLEGKWPNLPFYSFSKNSQKTFLILLLMFSVGFASAQSFVVNDLKYTIINPTEVSVSKDGACPTGELTIPSLVTDPNSSIEYSVRTIEANAFAGCSALTSVILGDSITTIATNGFRVCNSLTSIDLPNSLTTIGITAFESCSALTSVTFGESLTTIEPGSFANCISLTSIDLPNSLTTIETQGFASCSALTSIDLPNSLTTIGAAAFFDCTSIEEVIVAWQTPITITSSLTFNVLTLSDVTLKVPKGTVATYEAAAVWQDFSPIVENVVCFTIGDLEYCEIDSANVRVTKADPCPTGELTIPSLVTDTNSSIEYSVRTIGANAFENCSGLTSVTLGDSITTIGDNAFFSCSGLTSVTFPNSLTSIETAAFQNCTGLTSIDLPNSITTLGGAAFKDCSNLASIILGDSITSIGSTAFESCSALTSINLPNSITTLGSAAFKDCSNLASIILGDSITTIKISTFSNCSALTSVTLGESLTTIEKFVFQSCSALTSIDLPESLTTIGNNAFRFCTNLEEVTVAWQTPITISSDVFNGLTLSDITLKVPEGKVATYEASTVWQDFSPIVENIVCFTIAGLQYCEIDSANVRVTKAGLCPTGELTIPSLVTDTNSNIEYSVRTIEASAFQSCSALTSVILGDSITTIVGSAFRHCTALTSVTLPNSLTTLGGNAFNNCSALTSVTLPNSLTSFGGSAFRSCSSLTSIDVPNSVTTIGVSTFRDCSSLTSIDLPNSVTNIGSRAFQDCSALISINLPDSLATLGSNAFNGCTELTSVTLPNSVTNIGAYAFASCSALISIDLPESLTNLQSNAFNSCTSLKEVIVAWQTPLLISSSVFNGLTLSNITLKVPEGKVATYEAAAVWQNFSPIVENGVCFTIAGLQYCEIDSANVRVTKAGLCPTGALTIPSLVTDTNSSIEYSVRTIEANAFAVCTELTSVTIGDSLTTIGNNAFRACSSLTSATLPNSLTNIGSGTFENCSALTSVTLPNSLTTIGSGAFTSCSALTSITLPNSVTTIESETFENCSTLTSIDLPDSLTNIGSNAFRSCTGLTSVDLPESLTTIGNNAFRDCSILEEVNVAWQTPITITSLAFSGLTLSDITLKVPSSTIYLYEAAAVWTNFNPISAVHNVIDTVCGSYNLGDSTYTVSGMYTDTIMTTENNDSIVNLTLTILEAPEPTELEEMACGSFTFGDSTYIVSGTYVDTLESVNGCDSLVTLELTVLEAPDTTHLQEMACGSFTFADSTYEASGTYTNATETANGCDSIVILELTIFEVPGINELEEMACGSFQFGESIYTTSGIYTDSLFGANGCDSIVILDLTINPEYLPESKDTLIALEIPDEYQEGDFDQSYVTFNGKVYMRFENDNGQSNLVEYDGDSFSTIASPEGYDNPNKGYNGDPIVYNGKLYLNYQSNDDKDVLVEFDGTNLTPIISPEDYNNSGSGYNGNPVVYNGKLYLKYSIDEQEGEKSYLIEFDGTNLKTVIDKEGYVESIIENNGELYLYFKNKNNDFELVRYNGTTLKFILSSSYVLENPRRFVTFQGDLYLRYKGIDENNNGEFNLVKIDGDSLTVIDNPIGFQSSSSGGYYGSPIVYGGNLFLRFNSDDNKDVLVEFDGTNLTPITSPVGYDDPHKGYSGDPIVYNGKLYLRYRSNNGESVLVEFDGDSLTVISNPDGYTSDGYEGGPILFDSKLILSYFNDATGSFDLITFNGTKFNVIDSPQDFDGEDEGFDTGEDFIEYDNKLIISFYSDNLGVNPVVLDKAYDPNQFEIACDSFAFGGNTISTSGIYIDSLNTVTGCDSIIILDLTIISSPDPTPLQETACESYNFGGTNYTTSGMYNHTLESANSCDSLLNLDLTINYNTYNIFSFEGIDSLVWNGVTYTDSIQLEFVLTNMVGCDSIISINLNIQPSNGPTSSNQLIEICDGETLEIGNSVYTNNGIYIDTLTTLNGCCDSIVTTTLYVFDPLAKPLVSRPFVLTLATTQDYESYQWRRNGTEINGATSYQYFVEEAGSYQVEVTNDDACSALSDPYNLGTTDISESLIGRFMVYPNPTKENATIQIPFGEEFNLEVTNVLGEIVISQKLVSTETTLQSSRFKKGVYFISLYNEKGTQTLRFVKN